MPAGLLLVSAGLCAAVGLALAGFAPAASTGQRHYATHELDRPPLPRSAPDERHVENVPNSGLPIRVRVFIDSRGTVSKVAVLAASEIDGEAVERVKTMFLQTAFVPGNRGGREVDSYMDVELRLEPRFDRLATPSAS